MVGLYGFHPYFLFSLREGYMAKSSTNLLKHRQARVSMLIPCFNEGESVRKCIDSCLVQTTPIEEIVVVDDGSTDDSREILKSYGDRIKLVALEKNTGNKSLAQEQGMKHVTGDIVIMTDADTLLHPEFVSHIVKPFSDPAVGAAGGYVQSLRHNWLTACRELDYIIGQNVYKTAQSYMNFIFVIPGCAAAFRRKDVDKLSLDHDTVTEDLDFTYQLHRNGRRIAFVKQAIVYTQDPPNISSYIRQMQRWYGGGWQNFLKHFGIIAQKPAATLELSLMYIEGLIFALFAFFFLIVNPVLFLQVFYLGSVSFAAVFGIYGAVRRRRSDFISAIFIYPAFTLINSFIFIREFVREIVLRKRTLVWLKADRIRL